MLKSLKISLLRLRTLLPDIIGISTYNGYEQLPMSPTLYKKYCKDYPSDYIEKRQQLLDKKNLLISHDDNLRDYQNQDVSFLTSLKNKAIFNQQRTGKTPTSLVTMRELNQANTLIVAPGSTIYNWLLDYKIWHGGPAMVLSSRMTKKVRTEYIRTFKGALIMPYGIATNDLIALQKRKLDTIVVDEAHRLRNYQGHRSKKSPHMAKALITLSRQAKFRYVLTGTPAPNHPKNIYGILAFLYPTLFTSFWRFIDYYFTIEDRHINRTDTVKFIGTFKSKQKELELQEFLETVSIQRKRKDVMKWLIEVEPTIVKIPLHKKQLKYLDELHEFFEIEGTDVEAINHLDRMIKERQLVTDPRLLGITNVKSAKTDWLHEYRKDYPEKRIMFATFFTSYLKILHKELPDSTLLIGGMSDKRKNEIETEFNEGKIKLLLTNIDVAKEGMKLYGANTLIMIDRSLTYTDNEQIFDRILPITEQIAQDLEPQEIIILTTDSTIENYLHKMLQLKKSMTDIINDYNKGRVPPRVATPTKKIKEE